MKPRRVVVTLEIRTDKPLWYLRNTGVWSAIIENSFDKNECFDLFQVQANVIRDEKPKGKP